MMRVYSGKDGVILEREGSRIRLCRGGGLASLVSASICGDVQLFLGKITVDRADFLLFATQTSVVGSFQLNKGANVHRIERVCAVPLSADERTIKKTIEDSLDNGRLKQGKDKILRFVQDKISASPTGIQEVLRLFNDTPDFYYCSERDLTQTTQLFFSDPTPRRDFFWNFHLLSDIIDSPIAEEHKRIWAVPIIQGFARSVELSLLEDSQIPTVMQLTLISRRSVNRAGTRYLRRGIDTEANVANFVESEVILNIFDHHLSFVQVRGSVPIFWSQKGYKYRPPLVIDRSLDESLPFFEKHITRLVAEYGTPLIAVNLVDQIGRELQLAQSYIEHASKHSCENLLFVSFDLHQHCRGLRFDKIADLISSMEEELNGIGFCWVDKTGEVVRRQTGVVRTNCVDCLDRTNVVQGNISQYMCMRQAQRLGIFGPLCDPPEALVNILQSLWADNGDAISTQVGMNGTNGNCWFPYAGTAALKGDVTRCGERKLTGIMKDGYNSASRYYLSHTKDTSRQKAINVLLGVPDQGSETMAGSPEDDPEEEDESVSRLVNETIHFLLPDNDVVVGGWGLVDAQNGGDTVDSVVLLTRKCLHVATYDDEAQKLVDVRLIPLTELEQIELGRISRSSPICLRILYKADNQTGIILHAAKTRLFNNVAIRLKNQDEADEYMESISEQIRVTYAMATSKEIEVMRVQRLSVNRQNTAQKAFASMTSALRLTSRRPPSTTQTTKASDSPASDDSGTCTPIPEVSAPVQFRDDTTLGVTVSGAPPEVRPSASEGRLVDKSNIVSRLKGLNFIRQGQDSRTNPFEKLSNLINESHTRFIML